MNRNTCPGGLIGDEQAQLEEGPGMPLVAMFASNRCSLPNPRQVFKSNCLARYDGFLDKLLTDAVVHVFLKSGFASPYAADAALGIACPAILQALAA